MKSIQQSTLMTYSVEIIHILAAKYDYSLFFRP